MTSVGSSLAIIELIFVVPSKCTLASLHACCCRSGQIIDLVKSSVAQCCCQIIKVEHVLHWNVLIIQSSAWVTCRMWGHCNAQGLILCSRYLQRSVHCAVSHVYCQRRLARNDDHYYSLAPGGTTPTMRLERRHTVLIPAAGSLLRSDMVLPLIASYDGVETSVTRVRCGRT